MPNELPVKFDTNYPLYPSFDKFIVGVSKVPSNQESSSYQFVFNDGDRTKASDAVYKKHEW